MLFVLYWIYDPSSIEENYLPLDVWMQRNAYELIYLLHGAESYLRS